VVNSLTLFRNNDNLRSKRSIDELGQIKPSNARNKTKLDITQRQSRQVEAVKYTSASNSQQGGKLLELQQRLDAKGVGLEEFLEGTQIEVVLAIEDYELLEVQLIHLQEIVEVDLAEGLPGSTAVDGALLALLNGIARGGSGEGSKGGNKDGRELHLDILIDLVVVLWMSILTSN
jgi:hypothetical protein